MNNDRMVNRQSGIDGPGAAATYTIMVGGLSELLYARLVLPVATIRSNGSDVTLTGTAGNDVFDPGTNTGGTNTMIGNGGNDVFYVHSFNDVVVAAAGGINTVITDYGWGTYTLPDNVQNLIYTGTASYAHGWITLTGNALNDTIVANNQGDKLMAGTGNDMLVGGAGSDIFVISAGDGNDTIARFHTSGSTHPDTVQLLGYGFTSFAEVQAAMQQSGTSVVLTLTDGHTLTFAHHMVADFSAADFGFSTPGSGGGGGGGGVGSGGGLTTTTIVTNPTILQPTQPGQIVGFMLRNNGTAALGAHEVSFAQTFASGAVPAGSQLTATIDGQTVAVQMDVKTTNADGSAKMVVITLLQPAMAASAALNGMLSLSTAGAGTPIDISRLNASNYNFVVNLNMHDPSGGNTAYTFNAGTLLQQALLAGTVTTELRGSQVTQVQFTAQVAGSMYLTFNISSFADGTTATDVSFDNDIALSASGGTVNYDATITQNGSVVLQQSNINQYQYQTWHQKFYSNGAPQAQVVQDLAALERTGAIGNYDLSAGVGQDQITAEGAQLGGSTYGILGPASVLQYMPQTGGRPDIGPQPQWNAVYLLSQDPTATAYMLAQANAAGSVPWHFVDTNTGNYVSVFDHPNLWIDPRATTSGGYTPLTQSVSTSTGWSTDGAHQPDLSYLAYLTTGDAQYLDQLNAQASWVEGSDWTPERQSGQGLVANGQDQVREQAWSLREVDEAAYANPDGSAEKTYFSQLETNNWHWLVSQIPNWTAAQGQAYGYLPGTYGTTAIAPWEQDYFVSTAVEAAEQGNQDAVTFLKWETNFIAGRFVNAANGFNPVNGVAYNITINAPNGTPLQTWAAIEQASEANNQTNTPAWLQSQGDYAQLAEESLTGIITVTGSTEAMDAYGWLLASGAPYLDPTGTQFDLVARLSDGNLLTSNHIIISTDTTATTLTGSNNDELIHAGSGNDIVNGGSGINLLFAGSGTDTLNGGSNNDYLFAGGGADTLYGAGGINFMQAGTGADVFQLSAADVATDMIAGFRPGLDHLQILGQSPTGAFDQSLLAGATQDAGGNAVLHLSASHSVTLQGVGLSHLSTSIFQ